MKRRVIRRIGRQRVVVHNAAAYPGKTPEAKIQAAIDAAASELQRRAIGAAVRAIRRVMRQRGGPDRILKGLERAMYEAHIQGRIHGTKAWGGCKEMRDLMLATYSEFLTGVRS